jgi:hypothetical protein
MGAVPCQIPRPAKGMSPLRLPIVGYFLNRFGQETALGHRPARRGLVPVVESGLRAGRISNLVAFDLGNQPDQVGSGPVAFIDTDGLRESRHDVPLMASLSKIRERWIGSWGWKKFGI